MSLHGPYDNDNLFAKILRGEIPSVQVYEDRSSRSWTSSASARTCW
jgi:hypothetical protein